MKIILRFFFKLLYHQFAFAYDSVAATVSWGHWMDWVISVIPFITGTRVLEIGHGPGHLQRILLDRNLSAVAIDESTAMGRLAQRNTDGAARLTRAQGQHLPFRDRAFDIIVATFPAEYITEPGTLAEVRRCLSDGGKFITLPVAIPGNPFLAWLFRVTCQAPSEALKTVQAELEAPFLEEGFSVETHILDLQSGTLMIIVASEPVEAQESEKQPCSKKFANP